jgi:glycosyltransferase involved in cell wall biosynthesis
LVFGWAGNAGDSCKGLHDILLPACGSDFTLRVADGSIAPQDMRSFYHSIDVLIVSSSAEGNPLPLLEAMACGCFVISTDVGIVPEVVRHRENGLIIDRRIACFRAALEWCELNASFVRNAGPTSAAEIASERSWASVARFSREAFRLAYAKEHMRSL